jgi:uncharacterized protein with von Willebrand factor type A (vWA) domain
MSSRYNLRPNPIPTGPTNGQIATSAVNDLTRQRIQTLQLKQQQQQITKDETDELANLMGQMNMNRGGRRRRRTNKRRRTFRKKRSTKRRRY